VTFYISALEILLLINLLTLKMFMISKDTEMPPSTVEMIQCITVHCINGNFSFLWCSPSLFFPPTNLEVRRLNQFSCKMA